MIFPIYRFRNCLTKKLLTVTHMVIMCQKQHSNMNFTVIFLKMLEFYVLWRELNIYLNFMPSFAFIRSRKCCSNINVGKQKIVRQD